MTAIPNPPLISCPSSLVASCAPLLGFTPRDCVVVMIHEVPGRDWPVLVRLDRPEPGMTSAAGALASSVHRTGGLAVDIVAWLDAPDGSVRDDLPMTNWLSELTGELDRLGVEVAECLSTNGRVWWSHACLDPLCCPEQATALDQEVMTSVQAEFVYAGYAPMASREAVAARLARDEPRASRVAASLSGRRRPSRVERWRDAEIEWLDDLLLPPDGRPPAKAAGLTAAAAARLHMALADIRVRDTVLRRVAIAERACPMCWAETIETLCDAVRCAPEGAGAPAATFLALIAWLDGEGALATIALDRAFEDDPSYSLADLAHRLIVGGTDPRTWQSSLAGLSEAACRNGQDEPSTSQPC
ncbi:MAG: DUF4192 domain-containing protein [Propionicimonas sp.]